MQHEFERDPRPDGILLIAAYYLLLGAGFIIFALLLTTTALPATFDYASVNNYGNSGYAVLLILILLFLLIGAGMIVAVHNLWVETPSARAGIVLISAMLTASAGLSIPVLLLVLEAGMALYPPLASAIAITLASGFSLHYLTRAHIRQYFTRKFH